MAKQDTFTAEEWTLLRLVPSLVSGGTSAAEPSGIFSSIKEATAGAAGMAEAFKANGALELFASLAADRSIPGMPDPKTLLGEGTREQQLANFKGAVLERVKSAVDLVARKAQRENSTLRAAALTLGYLSGEEFDWQMRSVLSPSRPERS